MQPEIMLLPSVYLILPLGSLFMTVNSSRSNKDKAIFPPKCSPSPISDCILAAGDVPCSQPAAYLAGGDRHRKSVCSQVDRELNLIDSIDTSETEAMLREKAKGNLDDKFASDKQVKLSQAAHNAKTDGKMIAPENMV